MDQPETPYLETEILLKVLQHNMDAAEEMIRDMLPGERAIFERQVGALHGVIRRIQRNLGEDQ